MKYVFDRPNDVQELDRMEELDNIQYTVENVKRELDRKLSLAREYGYAEYADDLAMLLAELDGLRKGYR